MIHPATSHAQAPNYFPLGPGSQWQYQTYESGILDISYEGPRTVDGQPTISLYEEKSGQESHQMSSFWSKNDEGDLFHHGTEVYQGIDGDFILVYDTPLLWLDLPLEVGKTWQTHSTFTQFYFDEYTSYWEMDAQAEVFRERTLAVPAGTFQVFGIRYFLSAVPLDGKNGHRGGLEAARAAIPFETESESWYCENVGVVQRYRTDGWPIYRLVDYNVTVPVETQTWGRIKAMFH